MCHNSSSLDPAWPVNVQLYGHWPIGPLLEFLLGTYIFVHTVTPQLLNRFAPSHVLWIQFFNLKSIITSVNMTWFQLQRHIIIVMAFLLVFYQGITWICAELPSIKPPETHFNAILFTVEIFFRSKIYFQFCSYDAGLLGWRSVNCSTVSWATLKNILGNFLNPVSTINAIESMHW